jgi:hypothetical protein
VRAKKKKNAKKTTRPKAIKLPSTLAARVERKRIE